MVAALEERALLAALSEFVDPHPEIGNGFGEVIVPLSTGNVVITAPFDDAGGTDAGAVYLFNGATGQLISTLTGSHPDDKIGSGGVVALQTGNFVIVSPNWDQGTVTNAGAVTWGHGKRGVSGVVSARNSLTGSQSGDQIGGGGVALAFPFLTPAAVVALSNGNYVVRSSAWDHGSVVDAGAVTWGNGRRGVKGAVSPTNSLVGSQANDSVGNNGITALANGNYVVSSSDWSNGSAYGAGAVTWGSGAKGRKGVVGASNSLVGSQTNDHLGYLDSNGLSSQHSIWPRQGYHNGVTALSNGNYVISSPSWSNGALLNVGAATWANGTKGIVGVVSLSNSLIGVSDNDRVGGHGTTGLKSGNYVVKSPQWSLDLGAATWGNGQTGVKGVVSSENSLVGTRSGDKVSSAGVAALANGNYVVSSPDWDNDSSINVGAATWGSGDTGISGQINSQNSLVGIYKNSRVGAGGVTGLSNGHFVVNSPGWNDGLTVGLGAATWGNGYIGATGFVSEANSLIGSQTFDGVGEEAVALMNGNYVVISSEWSGLKGAVTWGNGQTGTTGVVSSENSLVGSRSGDRYNFDFDSDRVGYFGVTPLTNGNYVVNSAVARGTAKGGLGAVTWGNGESGVAGVVSEKNSLVGSNLWSFVGSSGVTALSNGNYLVSTPNVGYFEFNRASVTWGNGQTGTIGSVDESNSLIGPELSFGQQLAVTIDPSNSTVIVRFDVEGRRSVFVRAQ